MKKLTLNKIKMKIEVCTGKTCKGKFSEYITKRIENDIAKFDIKGTQL